MTQLRKLTALRYVQPLREGGSLPAVVDTEAGAFVVKFRGAGQGRRALVAELLVGLIARELDLPVPELALVEVAPVFGRSEPDPEIRDLLKASHGLNLGLRYLDGAFNFSVPAARELIPEELAARIVWLDAFVTNPDRTPRNPNLLIWSRRPWLIDHGAALYAHHDWDRVDSDRARTPFPLIRDHVLLEIAGDLDAADRFCAARLTADALRHAIDRVPDTLLVDHAGGDPDAAAAASRERDRYLAYLTERIQEPRLFVDEAVAARDSVRANPKGAQGVRR